MKKEKGKEESNKKVSGLRRIFTKTIGLTLKTTGLAIILTCVMFGVLTEPDIKLPGVPSFQPEKIKSIGNVIEISDNDGLLMRESAYNNYVYVRLDAMPAYIPDAFISIEDRRFYSHGGIDYIRLASALKADIISGSFKEGGSTISQQLIKNTHLTNEKTLRRKLLEARLAIGLERSLSKRDIIESYLNILYFGHNVYGIGSAAKVFFGKAAADLSIAEGAVLAGVINNPRLYSPYLSKDACLKRQKLVLKQMLKFGKITASEYDGAVSESIVFKPLAAPSAQHISYLIDAASLESGLTKGDLFKSNAKIETFLDLELNAAIEEIIARHNLPENACVSVIVTQTQAGSVVGTGSIGDAFNLVRQPASTLKPLLCYAPAIESNNAVPLTPIADVKTDFGGYCPSNYKEKYEGWTTLQSSLINSSNVCAVKLLNINGIDKAKDYAQRCGVNFSETDNGLSIALGGMTYGITLKQIADVYSMFARGGIYKNGGFIKRICDGGGNVLYSRSPADLKVFSESTAFLINSMLSECAKSGTARLIGDNKNICAKTGTAGDETGNTDAYCIAYNPDYTVAVWVGSTRGRIGVTGGGIPTLIAKDIFTSALPDCNAGFQKPSGVKEYEIDLKQLTEKHILVQACNLPKIYTKKAYFTEGCKPRKVYYQNTVLVNDKDFYSMLNDRENACFKA